MATSWRDVPEAGTALAIRFLVWFARVFGRRVLHALLVPVTVYFVLVRPASRRVSKQYLALVLDRPVRFSDVFRHFYTFARVIADRVYFMSGDMSAIPIRVHGAERLQTLVDQGKGGIVLSAHLGSFEAARILGGTISDAVLRIVLDRQVNQKLVEGFESANPEFASAIIDVRQAPASLALEIADALKKGEWVGFLADRVVSKGRNETVDFLGAPSQFPVGPAAIAGMFKVPLVSVFPLYINGGYEVYCDVISESAEVPRSTRQEALRAYVVDYVAQLEKYVALAPYNWFNFFDYWDAE